MAAQQQGGPPTLQTLYEACSSTQPGSLTRVRACLDAGLSASAAFSDDLLWRHCSNSTPLHVASIASWPSSGPNQQIEIMTLLHQRGALLEARDKDDFTPLFRAIKHGNVLAAQWLIGRGASLALKTKDGKNPMHFLGSDDGAFFDELRRAGLSIEARDSNDMTPLMSAAACRSVPMVKFFAAKGAKLDAVVKATGDTALHQVCVVREADTAVALLESGASYALKNKKGETAFDKVRGTPKQVRDTLQHLKSAIFDKLNTEVQELRKKSKLRERPASICSTALTLDKFADVVFVTGDGERVAGHKVVLAAGSSYLRQLFTNEAFKEGRERDSEIGLDQSAAAVRAVLRFAYTSEVDDEACNLHGAEIMDLATLWCLPGLMRACEKNAIDGLSVQTVIPHLLNAHLHSLKKLKKASIELIRKRAAAVLVLCSADLPRVQAHPELWEELKQALAPQEEQGEPQQQSPANKRPRSK